MNSPGNVQISCPMYGTGNLNVTVSPGAGVLELGTTADNVGFNGGNGNITIANYSSNTVLCGDLNGWKTSLGSGPNYFTVAAGTVMCADGPLTGGDAGGNVFNNYTIVNILAGATYSFNTNAESMGAIEGAGNITNLNEITLNLPGNYTFAGSISGKSGAYVTQSAVGTLTLAGSNAYNGATTISTAGGGRSAWPIAMPR